MTRIDHRQHHVGDAHEVFPHLPDAEIPGRRRCQSEDIERDRRSKRLETFGENRDAGLHAFALRLAGLARGEHRLRHRFFRFVGKAHVVELHFVEAEMDGFRRELRRVDPDRVVVRIHPGDVDPVAP